MSKYLPLGVEHDRNAPYNQPYIECKCEVCGSYNLELNEDLDDCYDMECLNCGERNYINKG